VFYLSVNPTAENMAAYLMQRVIPDLFKTDNIRCTHLRLYETPNCFVEIS